VADTNEDWEGRLKEGLLEPISIATTFDFATHKRACLHARIWFDAKSLVPYRQRSAGTAFAPSDSGLQVRSGVDTAIWTKPCWDLAGQLL
jgi:hypothetical protein